MAHKVKNWSEFQHYKNRRPPWIKLYRKLLDDLDFERLSGDAVKLLIKLWLIASETNDGSLPDSEALAWRLRLDSEALASIMNELNQWITLDASSVLANCKQDARPETERETEKETKTKKRRPPQTPPGGFAQFWSAYPKKIGKQAAVRAWNKARRNGLPLIEDLIQIIEYQNTWPQWQDSAYIPNPATWLNAGRWDDERPADPYGSETETKAAAMIRRTRESCKRFAAGEDQLSFAEEETDGTRNDSGDTDNDIRIIPRKV